MDPDGGPRPRSHPRTDALELAQLDDQRVVRLYRLLSEILADDTADDDPRLGQVADIMAAMAEQAYATGEGLSEEDHDGLLFDLMNAFAAESDPRTSLLVDLMRDYGWAHWIRLERLAEPPG